MVEKRYKKCTKTAQSGEDPAVQSFLHKRDLKENAHVL